VNFTVYRNGKKILTLDLIVYPCAIIAEGYSIINETEAKEWLPFLFLSNPLERLNIWLQNRCVLWDYKEGAELDAFIHERLGTIPWQFGRMTEYQGIVAMLDGFRLKEDDFSIYPEETQLFWFGDTEPGMNRVFRIQKNNE